LLKERSEHQIKPPVEVDPRIPRRVNDIIVRCLQLDPAKRYQSADQIIQDLEIWLGIRKRHTANWKLLSIAAALIVLLAGALIYNLQPRRAVTHAPVKILVSDFANSTGNPVLTGTLEPVLSTALEDAAFITTYNRGQARKTLSKLSGSTKLDESSARLVARREGVGVVVAGSIRREGNDYKLSAQALDTVNGKVIDDEGATSSSPEQLNKAVAKVAAGFRKALGDVVPKSKQIAAAETFSSQSLEASQQYAQAQELQWAEKWQDALKAYDRSIQLDSGLGRAYAGIAVILANMGNRKDAEKYFRLAMSKINRMSDREKYRTRGGYYLLERDYEKAIEQFKALEKQYPADSAGIATCRFLCAKYERCARGRPPGGCNLPEQSTANQ
jgi:tetratricopeptide (TPR) repeat protein